MIYDREAVEFGNLLMFAFALGVFKHSLFERCLLFFNLHTLTLRFSVFLPFLPFSSRLFAAVRRGPKTLMLTDPCLTAFSFRFLLLARVF